MILRKKKRPVIPTVGLNTGERRIISAALKWGEGISTHPSLWMDDRDAALIEAVRFAHPELHCKWLANPEYRDWLDSASPALSEEANVKLPVGTWLVTSTNEGQSARKVDAVSIWLSEDGWSAKFSDRQPCTRTLWGER